MLKLNCLTLFHKVITLQAKIRQIDNSGNNVSHQIELQTVETLYITFCINLTRVFYLQIELQQSLL